MLPMPPVEERTIGVNETYDLYKAMSCFLQVTTPGPVLATAPILATKSGPPGPIFA